MLSSASTVMDLLSDCDTITLIPWLTSILLKSSFAGLVSVVMLPLPFMPLPKLMEVCMQEENNNAIMAAIMNLVINVISFIMANWF